MKRSKTILVVTVLVITLSSCNFFRNIFGGGDKNGCPSNVNNVGAEKLLDDGYKPKNKEEARAIKQAKKANLKAARKNPYMY